jgi:hypothetical protein
MYVGKEAMTAKSLLMKNKARCFDFDEVCLESHYFSYLHSSVQNQVSFVFNKPGINQNVSSPFRLDNLASLLNFKLSFLRWISKVE